MAVFSLFLGCKQALAVSPSQVVDTRLQLRISFQRKQSSSRLRRQAVS